MTPTLAIILILIAATVMLVLSIKRIPEGQVYTLRRLGRPAGVLTAGTHIILPLVERIAHKICISGYTLAVDEHLDTMRSMRGRVWWQVLDPERADAVIDRADDMIRLQLQDAVQLPEAETTPDVRLRNQAIKRALNSRLRQRGVLVTRVELDLAA